MLAVTPPRRRVVGALLILLVGVLAAASPAAAKASGVANTAKARSIVLIGDSVMAALNPNSTNAAAKVIGAGGWKVVIDAKVNRSTSQGAQVAQSRRNQETDTVVVMLGHNDGGNAALFKRHATAVLQALKGVPHVYWLTMRAPRYAAANAVLRSLAAQYKNLRLIDWANHIQSGWTGRDGLHLNGSGATGMARLILASIR